MYILFCSSDFITLSLSNFHSRKIALSFFFSCAWSIHIVLAHLFAIISFKDYESTRNSANVIVFAYASVNIFRLQKYIVKIYIENQCNLHFHSKEKLSDIGYTLETR